ncbi:MAG: Fic family protein [Bacilli bacterium]|jgi:Fic family protein|nr:Fic family protein [Bacilli bacterium]
MKQRLLERLLEEKEMRLKDGLYHQTQISFSYNSNKIEGSRLSEDQARYIYETNTVTMEMVKMIAEDDIVETVNHFSCFDYMLLHTDEELTEDLIKEFHLLLKRNTSDANKEWFQIGGYKLRPNVVGDRKTTAPSKVGSEIQKLLSDYTMRKEIMVEDVVDFHYRFERIHPFQDGNGRVGRIILFKECLKHDILPFIINHKHKLFYYRGLTEYATEQGYLMGTCLSAQDEYEKVVSYFYPDFSGSSQEMKQS